MQNSSTESEGPVPEELVNFEDENDIKEALAAKAEKHWKEVNSSVFPCPDLCHGLAGEAVR
jgi:hypothetical protein